MTPSSDPGSPTGIPFTVRTTRSSASTSRPRRLPSASGPKRRSRRASSNSGPCRTRCPSWSGWARPTARSSGSTANCPTSRSCRPKPLRERTGSRPSLPACRGSIGANAWRPALPFEMELELCGKDERRRPFLTRIIPLRDPEGKLYRWIGTHIDISEQKRREAHIQFIADELSHRSKNLLAVVMAIANQTAKHAGNVDQYHGRFTERLAALVPFARAAGEGPVVRFTVRRSDRDAIEAIRRGRSRPYRRVRTATHPAAPGRSVSGHGRA